MRKLGNILVVGSSLFFIETAFEMYVLTVIHGPQMLGFSMVHIARGFFMLVMLSGLIYLCLGVFAFGVVILNLVGKLGTAKGYARLMLLVLGVHIIHTVLLLTYDYWASVLFPRSG